MLAHPMVLVPQDLDLGCEAGQGVCRACMPGREQVVHLDPEAERCYMILQSGHSPG